MFRFDLAYSGWVKVTKNPVIYKLQNNTTPAFEEFYLNKWWKPAKQNNYGSPVSPYAFYLRIEKKNALLYNSYENLKLLRNKTVTSVEILNKQRNIYTNSPCLNIGTKEPSKKNKLFFNICPLRPSDNLKIYCILLKELGKDDIECKKVDFINNPNKIFIKKVFNQPIFVLPIPSFMCNEVWDYKKGGEDWQCDCKEGQSQAPIDLPSIKNSIAIKESEKPYFLFTFTCFSLTSTVLFITFVTFFCTTTLVSFFTFCPGSILVTSISHFLGFS